MVVVTVVFCQCEETLVERTIQTGWTTSYREQQGQEPHVSKLNRHYPCGGVNNSK